VSNVRNLIAAILLTHTTVGIPGSTSPVVAISHAKRAVGGSLVAQLQGPGHAASITRFVGAWESKYSGSEEDAREEGDHNHAERGGYGTHCREKSTRSLPPTLYILFLTAGENATNGPI
jgi:hypothetical protein